MQLQFKSPPEVPDETGKDFSVLLICEDTAKTERAMDVLHLVANNLKAESGRLFYQWWNFKFLSVVELQGLFRAEAAAADMIIVGLHEQWDLPVMLATLKDWLPGLRKNRPGVLVAVLDAVANRSDASEARLSQLKEATVLSHMDFFVTRAKEVRDAGRQEVSGGEVRQFAERPERGATWIAGRGGMMPAAT